MSKRKPIQEWPTKKAFVLDHLHLPIQDVISLGKEHQIYLTKGTVYTVRSEAAKNGANIEIMYPDPVDTPQPPPTRKASAPKATTTTLIHTEATATVTQTTTLMATTGTESLDAILEALIDKAMKDLNVEERIKPTVEERCDLIARRKVEAIVTRVGNERAQQYFSNF